MGILGSGVAKSLANALIGFDSMIADARAIIMGNVGDNWTAMLGLSAILKPFCLVLVAVCFLIEMARTAARVNIVTWEHGIKLLVRLCLAKVILDIAPEFLRACYNQSQTWVSGIGTEWGATQVGTTLASKVIFLMENMENSFWSQLCLWMVTAVVVIAIWLCGIMIKTIAYGRLVELFVHLVISPLPCAFIPMGDGMGGGVSRTTMKFLRSFAAVCLQGVLTILVIKVFDVVLGNAIIEMAESGDIWSVDPVTVNTNFTNLTYIMLMGSIAMVMAMGKCGSWARKIMNAGG